MQRAEYIKLEKDKWKIIKKEQYFSKKNYVKILLGADLDNQNDI